jgi:phospholipase/carboxylesterase
MDAVVSFDGIELETDTPVALAVIWLHGLGADARDFEPVVPELSVGSGVRFVFPNAPLRPVTINGGMRMRAWYDIISFDRNAEEDASGIRASCDFLRALIDREISRGMPAERILLAGFSQGGAIALTAGLEESRRLGGILALSTYLPRTAGIQHSLRDDVPVWMGHGTIDPVVSLQLAMASRQRLQAAGIEPAWHSFPMAHSVCADEIAAIRAWLKLRLPGS